MLKVQSIENLPKTLPMFIKKKLFKFFTIEMDFEKLNYYSAPQVSNLKKYCENWINNVVVPSLVRHQLIICWNCQISWKIFICHTKNLENAKRKCQDLYRDLLHFQKSCRDKRSHFLINEVSNFKSQSSKKVKRKHWNSNHDLLHFRKSCKDKTNLFLITKVLKFE